MSKQGKFLVIDGPDAVGKTTQIVNIENYLEQQGFKTLKVREPGGSIVGEKIRELLLTTDMQGITEVMLFTASRVELINTIVKPALAEGTIVICDRFTDSTYAYQGHGRGLIKEVTILQSLIDTIIVPDDVLLLTAPIDVTLQRLRLRSQSQAADRLDSLDVETKVKIHHGYELADKFAFQRGQLNRIRFDASKTEQEVWNDIRYWLDNYYIPLHDDLKQ